MPSEQNYCPFQASVLESLFRILQPFLRGGALFFSTDLFLELWLHTKKAKDFVVLPLPSSEIIEYKKQFRHQFFY